MRHFSIRTEQAYVQWIERFIFFHGEKHPNEMSGQQVATFLTHLATKRNVAANTKNQALNALVFLYKEVLGRPLENIQGVVRANKPRRLPTVLTPDEVGRLLAELKDPYWLLGCIQYGSGLRLIESLRLRIMDLDFDQQAFMVRNGNGNKDRVVTLAEELIVPLE